MTDNDRGRVPINIIPTTDTPVGYSPEYCEDGQVWLLKDGKRLRLLRTPQEFAIAAQMAGGYARKHTAFDEWPESPFSWRGTVPQFPPPQNVRPAYIVALKLGWPLIEVSVSYDHAIWRLWEVVAAAKKHVGLIRQFDPVSSWFDHWITRELVIEVNGARYIKLRDLRAESARLAALMKAT